MAHAAHVDLHLVSRHRVNLLLMGADGVIHDALSRLRSELHEPIRTWTAPDPLELPSPLQSGTLILHGVDALAPPDQHRLVKWLEMSAGRTQVISTTNSRLLTLVDCGTFLDTLYYRLNVVCVDVTT
jgi:hypothetical protein